LGNRGSSTGIDVVIVYEEQIIFNNGKDINNRRCWFYWISSL
jgi:hypothetical protein